MFYQNPHSNVMGKNWLQTQIATRKGTYSKFWLRCVSSRFRQSQAAKKQLNANQLLRGYKGASPHGAYFICGTTWEPNRREHRRIGNGTGCRFNTLLISSCLHPVGEGGKEAAVQRVGIRSVNIWKAIATEKQPPNLTPRSMFSLLSPYENPSRCENKSFLPPFSFYLIPIGEYYWTSLISSGYAHFNGPPLTWT